MSGTVSGINSAELNGAASLPSCGSEPKRGDLNMGNSLRKRDTVCRLQGVDVGGTQGTKGFRCGSGVDWGQIGKP